MAGKIKRQVEIEKLLQWAYNDELIKRTTSSAEGIWQHIQGFGQNGGVNTDHGAAQRYPHFGVPHPDSLIIEEAVSALPRMAMDWKQSAEAIMGDLVAIMATRDTLLLATLNTAALVTMHARLASRPDWQSEPIRARPIPAERGANRPRIIGSSKGRDIYTIGSYCPLRYEPSPISIAHSRADYACWHDGLVKLAGTLAMQDHVALPPVAPARPWAGETEPVRRIYVVGERPRKEQPLPLKPQRALARRMTRAKQMQASAA